MAKASAYFSLKSIDDNHDVKELKREIDTLHGVISVSVNKTSDTVAVDFDTTGVDTHRIKTKMEKLGYNIVDIHTENNIM